MATAANTENRVGVVNTNPNHQPAKSSKIPPMMIAIGIITALGAVFVVLASKQIFPSSINAISQLGPIGQGIGFGAVGLGSVIAIVGLILVSRNSPSSAIPGVDLARQTIRNLQKTMKPKKEGISGTEEFPLKREGLLELKNSQFGNLLIPCLRNLSVNQAVYLFNRTQKNEGYYQFYFRDSNQEICSWRIKSNRSTDNEEHAVSLFQKTHTGLTAIEVSKFPTSPKLKDDKIPFEVKITLDRLFGGFGSVDKLSMNENVPFNQVWEIADEMVTKGLDEEGYPYIFINVRELNNTSRSRDKDRFIALRPASPDLLVWEQMIEIDGEALRFFDGPLTNEKGDLNPDQAENFEKFKEDIRTGTGESVKNKNDASHAGIKWLFVKPHPRDNS